MKYYFLVVQSSFARQNIHLLRNINEEKWLKVPRTLMIADRPFHVYGNHLIWSTLDNGYFLEKCVAYAAIYRQIWTLIYECILTTPYSADSPIETGMDVPESVYGQWERERYRMLYAFWSFPAHLILTNARLCKPLLWTLHLLWLKDQKERPHPCDFPYSIIYILEPRFCILS